VAGRACGDGSTLNGHGKAELQRFLVERHLEGRDEELKE